MIIELYFCPARKELDTVLLRALLRCCSDWEIEMQMFSMQKDFVFGGSLGCGLSFLIKSMAAFLILGCYLVLLGGLTLPEVVELRPGGVHV